MWIWSSLRPTAMARRPRVCFGLLDSVSSLAHPTLRSSLVGDVWCMIVFIGEAAGDDSQEMQEPTGWLEYITHMYEYTIQYKHI